MQTKDIPDSLVLNDLANYQGKWTGLYGVEFWTWVDQVSVKRSIFPTDMPEKLALSKMRSLYKRGLVGGCPCGCRGDFEITDKGLELIGRKRTEKYNGY